MYVEDDFPWVGLILGVVIVALILLGILAWGTS